MQLLTQDSGASVLAASADEALVEAALNRSLYGIGASVLPRSASSASLGASILPVTAWLQLVSVRNIAAPLAQDHPVESDRKGGRAAVASSSAARLLQLELTDGVSTALAVEHEPLIALDVSSLQPGRKLLVRSGTPLRDGILLLGPAHVTLPVRGKVDLLSQESAAIREADASRSENAMQARDAPIFRPYSQRDQAEREAQLEQQLAEAQFKERQRREAKAAPAAAPVVVAAPPALAAASALASRAHTQAQLELENEYQSTGSARGSRSTRSAPAAAAAAASAVSASAGPTAASVRRPPGKTSASAAAPVLSSFRTLLSAPLSECVSFSALAIDVQLFPPPAGQTAVVMQLTMQDSFQMRAALTASPRVFERFFWPQATFASMMAAPEGQARVKARLAECKSKLCLPQHFWDIELQIQQTAGAPRAFILLAIGEWVKSQRVVPRATTAAAPAGV